MRGLVLSSAVNCSSRLGGFLWLHHWIRQVQVCFSLPCPLCALPDDGQPADSPLNVTRQVLPIYPARPVALRASRGGTCISRAPPEKRCPRILGISGVVQTASRIHIEEIPAGRERQTAFSSYARACTLALTRSTTPL